MGQEAVVWVGVGDEGAPGLHLLACRVVILAPNRGFIKRWKLSVSDTKKFNMDQTGLALAFPEAGIHHHN